MNTHSPQIKEASLSSNNSPPFETVDISGENCSRMSSLRNLTPETNIKDEPSALEPAPTLVIQSSSSSSLEEHKSSEKKSSLCYCCSLFFRSFRKSPRWIKIGIVLCVAILLAALTAVLTAVLLPTKNRTTSSEDQPTTTTTPTSATASTVATTTTTTTPISPTTEHEPEDDSILFYVTHGVYTTTSPNDPPAFAQLPKGKDSQAFMVHLGDWNSVSQFSCTPETYQRVRELYQQSSVPVYFTVGNNESNDCPVGSATQTPAITLWKESLLNFEQEFWEPPQQWNIFRQPPSHPENWAFAYRGVVFVGIHLVGGNVNNQTEWEQREQMNLDWIRSNYFFFQQQEDTTNMLIFANEGLESSSTSFFSTNFLSELPFYDKMNFTLIHRGTLIGTVSNQDDRLVAHPEVENLSILQVGRRPWQTSSGGASSILRLRMSTAPTVPSKLQVDRL